MAPTSPDVETDPTEPGQDKEHRDLAARHEGGDPDHGEDRPEPSLILHRDSNELPRAAEDQCDDGGTDPVEERLNDRRPAKGHIECGDSAHDDEWRQDEWHRGRARAPEPATNVAEPHRELCGQGT